MSRAMRPNEGNQTYARTWWKQSRRGSAQETRARRCGGRTAHRCGLRAEHRPVVGEVDDGFERGCEARGSLLCAHGSKREQDGAVDLRRTGFEVLPAPERRPEMNLDGVCGDARKRLEAGETP